MRFQQGEGLVCIACLADNDQVLALIAQSLHLQIDYRTRYWVTVTAAT